RESTCVLSSSFPSSCLSSSFILRPPLLQVLDGWGKRACWRQADTVMFGYSFIIIIYYDHYDNLVTKWL
ncbi:MAG TPA: hypothetical protein QF555_04550, partial [Candidatus Thalassarchaeaceae archaeon]|nr:hypothetical protein [Candidatus Thalassarchaeaceae archaeon]